MIAVSEMWPLVVVMVQPDVERGLQGLDAREQCLMHGRSEEFLQHGAVEALDEAVGARGADPGLAVLDVVQRQVELVRVPLGAAELAAIVGEHGLNRQVELLVD